MVLGLWSDFTSSFSRIVWMRVMWRIVKNTEAITLRGTYLLPNRQTGATLSIDSLYGVPEGTRATCFWWKPSDNRPLFGLVCSLLKTWRETNFFCVPSGPPYKTLKRDPVADSHPSDGHDAQTGFKPKRTLCSLFSLERSVFVKQPKAAEHFSSPRFLIWLYVF